jgi:hypothetical protein
MIIIDIFLVNIECENVSLKEAQGPANVKINRTGATAITSNNITYV